MKAIDRNSNSSPYSARNMAKPVNFYCDAPQAKMLLLEGDFTGWSPVPMQRRVDGWWFVQLPLTHGHHQYRFVADGRRMLDPRAAGVARNEADEEVSIVAVS